MVEMEGEQDTLIVTKFMQNENTDKAADYLKKIATKLNEVYKQDADKAGQILEEAENAVRAAQLAEKFLEAITFQEATE